MAIHFLSDIMLILMKLSKIIVRIRIKMKHLMVFIIPNFVFDFYYGIFMCNIFLDSIILLTLLSRLILIK